MTARATRQVGVAALVAVPATALVVGVLSGLSQSIAGRSLLAPSLVLALAAVPFACTVPLAFGLNALGRERLWLTVLVVATLVDLAGVATFGSHGAMAAAGMWLTVQIAVVITVRHLAKRVGLR